jgi:hypothetical protein
MGKTMCEAGKKERKKRLEKSPLYRCKRCDTEVRKKAWVCKPAKI